jgi:hypothetical protein
MLTRQQVFDQACVHLRKQGCKSINHHEGICMYRGPNNTKCIVGYFIQDADYLQKMERRNLTQLIEWLESTNRDFPASGHYDLYQLLTEHRSLLSDLQLIHDEENTDQWEYFLKRCARDNGLEYTAPKEPT